MYNPIDISNYTYLSKLRILCNNLLKDLKTDEVSDEAICSKIKTIENSLNVMKSKFKYVFEYLFEFILGINVLDEQFDKYVEIINNYSSNITDKYDKIHKIYDINKNIFNVVKYNESYIKSITKVDSQQIGGSYKDYPLHHIMMGKGKSSVLTPLLSLYFCLIDKKKVFIIVPPHLVNQTKKTFINIIKIFELENYIFIKSDKDIKLDYLRGTKYDNSIFLIDEFDTILDPLKSNFNLTNEQCNIYIDIDLVMNIHKTIENIILINKEYINNTDDCTIRTDIKDMLSESTNDHLIATEIINVLLNIKNNILKYNINWGIHPEKGYAIPYMNKDTPLLESNFNSIILTLVLTFYYYYTNLYVNNDLIFDENLVSTFIYHNLQSNISNRFNVELSDIPEEILLYLNNLDLDNKNILLYEIIVPKIINSIKLCNYQYNLSFVDIINIPNVYKIGYSGTLNIDLPEDLIADHKFTKENIRVDLDEKHNVYYSLLVNYVMMPQTEELEKKLNKDSLLFLNTIDYIDNINSYDALIDTTGLFRYEPNENIAKILHDKIHRPIIYLNNNDDILVFDEYRNQKYDSNKLYTKPFFYYSQKHTVGIDIKQDNYPILNGLCLIDKLNTYTEVAQSVFRLRKLNQGHTIQLFSINKIDTNKTIIDILTDNEQNKKISKKENLQYQIIKANIRAKDVISVNDGLNTLDIRFKEKVKYFFNDYDYDKNNDKKYILQDILGPSNIDNLEKKIDDQQKLIENIDVKKLVYNLNSSSYATMEEQTTQTASNRSTNQLNKVLNSNEKYNLIDLDFSKYSHNYNITSEDIIEKNYILDVDTNNDKILFNPSLLTSLTQIDDTSIYENKIAYFSPLLIVCKNTDNKYLEIILCESTDIFLYDTNHLIINHYGNIINKNKYNYHLIDLLKDNDFINFLSTKYNYDDYYNLGNEFIEKNEIFFHIFFKFLNSNKIIDTYHDDFINDILDTYSQIILNINNINEKINKLVKYDLM